MIVLGCSTITVSTFHNSSIKLVARAMDIVNYTKLVICSKHQ
jgi:hypothetical protein